MGRFSMWSKKSRPGEFIRQLIIVILGIFITLTLTNFVTSQAKKKEYKKIMVMVYKELRENQAYIDGFIDDLTFERNAVRFLLQYRDNFEALPADTLNKYMWAHLENYLPTYTSNAEEVLKYSSIISYTDDINTVREIMEGYSIIKTAHRSLVLYADEKWKFIERYSEELENTDYWSLDHGPQRLSIQYHTTSLVRYISESLYDNIIEDLRGYSMQLGEITDRLGRKYKLEN